MKPLPARAPDGECAGQVQFNPFACPGESRVPASPRNILVFQLARFGDLVQTWPLLSRLRRSCWYHFVLCCSRIDQTGGPLARGSP